MKIVSAKIEPAPDHSNQITATLEDGSKHLVCRYFADELFFTEQEFVGMTLEAAREHHRKKDVEWLQTPGPAGNGIPRTS